MKTEAATTKVGSRNHKSPWYSAYLQMIGVQDLAEEDDAAFTAKSRHFRKELQNCSLQAKHKSAGIQYLPWLTECYVQCPTLTGLLEYLAELRDRLMSPMERVFVRAAVGEGKAFESVENSVVSPKAKEKRSEGSVSKDSASTPNFVFQKEAASLAGQLTTFKAVGVRISKKIMLRAEEELVFENCYVVGDGSTRRLVEYIDLRWQNLYGRINIRQLLVEIRHALHRSTKSGRYYAPILINFAQHVGPDPGFMMEMRKGVLELASSIRDKEPASEKLLEIRTLIGEWLQTVLRARKRASRPESGRIVRVDEMLTEEETQMASLKDPMFDYFVAIAETDYVNMLKNMPGGPYVYFVVIDRHLRLDQVIGSENYPSTASWEKFANSLSNESWNQRLMLAIFDVVFANWIFKARWLHRALDKTNTLGWPPEHILSPSSRGKMRKEIAKFVEDSKRLDEKITK